MKECAWCGDDFRGQGFVLDGNPFCSKECMEEWRKDVHGEDAAGEPSVEAGNGEVTEAKAEGEG